MKRNLLDAKLCRNRAACYTKLMEFPLSLIGIEERIKIDPIFVKCCLRQGYALISMKDLGQAMTAFGKALEIDPTTDGYRQLTIKSKDDPGEVRKRAAADPEILGDPSAHLTLEYMQNEPQAFRDHLRNPAITRKNLEIN